MSNKAFQQNLDDKKGPQPGGPYLIQMLYRALAVLKFRDMIQGGKAGHFLIITEALC